MIRLSVFNFENQEVRFVGTPDQPGWVTSNIVEVFYPPFVRLAATSLKPSEILSKSIPMRMQKEKEKPETLKLQITRLPALPA